MSSLLQTIILFSLAIASPLSFNHQQPLALQLTSESTHLKLSASASHEDWRTIPGDSPFRYCSDADPDTDLFDIERVTLNPNPIRLNGNFTVIITGTFRATIPPNAPVSMLISVPATDEPPMPAQNYTDVEEFCVMTGSITQPASADDVVHDVIKTYDNTIQTCNRDETPVHAVLPRQARIEQTIDVFWAYPDGLWFVEFDARMPEGDERRIFCLDVEVEVI